jgi:hypothetical protein
MINQSDVKALQKSLAHATTALKARLDSLARFLKEPLDGVPGAVYNIKRTARATSFAWRSDAKNKHDRLMDLLDAAHHFVDEELKEFEKRKSFGND